MYLAEQRVATVAIISIKFGGAQHLIAENERSRRNEHNANTSFY